MHRTITLAALAAGAALLSTPVAAPAHVTADPPARAAHTGVVARTPAPGARVRDVKRVAITFSQRLVTGKLDVHRGGRRVAPAATGPSGSTVAARFSRRLAAGTYTVTWRAVAADGHAQTGSWRFRVR